MIPDVTAHSTRRRAIVVRVLARSGLVLALLLQPSSSASHEAERRVTLTLAADGHFTLDVANDPMWLLLRLETFAGGRPPANMSSGDRDRRLAELTSDFADRIV